MNEQPAVKAPDTPEDLLRRYGKQYVTYNFVFNELYTVLKDMKAHSNRRVEALEQRLATLEAKPHVKFCGVWKAGGTYEPGHAATHQGGLWICKATTTGEPSKDFVGWQLAVKKGQA